MLAWRNIMTDDSGPCVSLVGNCDLLDAAYFTQADMEEANGPYVLAFLHRVLYRPCHYHAPSRVCALPAYLSQPNGTSIPS